MASLGPAFYRICRTRPGHAALRRALSLIRAAGLLRDFKLPLDSLRLPHNAIAELMELWRHIHWSSGDGMMPPRELLGVYKLAFQCPVRGAFVELGAWKGLTTSYLASACRARGGGQVHAVDTFEGTREHGTRYAGIAVCGGTTLPTFREFIRRAHVEQIVTAHVGDTRQVAEHFPDKGVALLLIDADHSYDGVKADFDAWLPLIAPGGTIIFHDYTMVDAGVRRFVDHEVIPRGDLRVIPDDLPENLLAVTKLAPPSRRPLGARKPGGDVQNDSPKEQKRGCSIVVTILNDVAGALGLIDALVGQTRPPDEIIVVDGGSTDGTAEALQRVDAGGVELCIAEVPGANIAEGRNHGIRLARHEIIACTDSGCVPDHDWLENLLRPFDDPDVAVVGGMYRIGPHGRLERVVGLLTMPGQLGPVDPPRFNPSARSLALRVSAWRSAGGFPEWLYAAEDTLFDCKLRRDGAQFAYARDAVVGWRPRNGLRAVWKQFRDYSRGEARIARGRSSARFWTRRYGIIAGLLVLSVACRAGGAGMFPIAATIIGAALLATGPFHSRARAIAARTWHPLDYPATILAGHWIAMATIVGHALGRRDRRRRPDVFRQKLREYWGSENVDRVPSWRMKRPPIPRTLVVSWHWPPTNRASTGVLASLFHAAPRETFRVLTRGLRTTADDGLASPALPTDRVPWTRRDDSETRIWTWLASVWTAAGMVLRAWRIHKEWPIQRIMAVYPHRFGFLAGWCAARLLGIPFVAYMHDLFAETLITRSRVKRTFWSHVDWTALAAARTVVVPTDEFAEHYRRRGIASTWILPHCRPGDVRRSCPPKLHGRLKLLYAGSVYQAHEGALETLVRATEQHPDVEIAFLTQANRILSPGRAEWLPRAEAVRRMHEADALVVLLSDQTPYPEEIRGCFPSKVVDYLAVGRPILAIVPPGCFVDRLVCESGCGVSVTSGSVKDVVRAIEVLQDPVARRTMSDAGHDVIEQLAPRDWMGRLCHTLACGPPVERNTTAFTTSTGSGPGLPLETACVGGSGP